MKPEEEPINGCLFLIVAFFIVSVLVLLAWNLGVVGLASAVGGSVASINYWTSLGVSAIYLLLHGVLKASS
jgi:hypothetical protein